MVSEVNAQLKSSDRVALTRSIIPFNKACFCFPNHLFHDDHASSVENSTEVVRRISRTFNGESNTDSSELKRPLRLSGLTLRRQVTRNFCRTLSELLSSGTMHFNSGTDVEKFIVSVARSLNHRLQESDTPLLRTWKTKLSHHPDPAVLPQLFASFCEDFFDRYASGLACADGAIKMSAWTEKEFNAQLHPLGDGCGRTSKAFACFFLARFQLALPRFPDRGEYFKMIARPHDIWHDYYRDLLSR